MKKRRQSHLIRERARTRRQLKRRHRIQKLGIRGRIRAARAITRKCIRSISTPKHIRFHGSTKQQSEYFGFVDRVAVCLAADIPVRIDFRPLERLYPCGLLLLMAQITTWLKGYPGRLSATYPKDGLAEEMLQRVGLLASLGLEPRRTISHTDVVRWDYFTGTDVSLSAVESFMERVREISSTESQSFLMDCVAEAVTNVKHHAYRDPNSPAPWWMFGTISDSKVSVAVLDCGASIPATLLEKEGVREYVSRWLLAPGQRDARMLEAAVNGRSRTKLPFRGKGLPEMLEFSRRVAGSGLALYSRRGAFVHTPDGQVQRKIVLSRPIAGTLVLWTVPIERGDSNV